MNEIRAIGSGLVSVLVLGNLFSIFFYDEYEDWDSDFWNFYIEYVPNYRWFIPNTEEFQKELKEKRQLEIEEAKKKVLPEIKYLNAEGRNKYFKEYILKNGDKFIYKNWGKLKEAVPKKYETEVFDSLQEVVTTE